MNRRLHIGRLAIYLEPRDLWIGAYWDASAIYVCFPLPILVYRWQRLRTTVQHYATDGCLPYHCCIHEVDEIQPATTYKVCFECKHVYQTAAELLAAHHGHYVGVPAGDLPQFDPAGLSSCPLCAHDF